MITYKGTLDPYKGTVTLDTESAHKLRDRFLHVDACIDGMELVVLEPISYRALQTELETSKKELYDLRREMGRESDVHTEATHEEPELIEVHA